MSDKDEINAKVYQPIKELKQKMYECKTQDSWDEYKGQLLELFKVAESMMDKSFYDKYRQGIVDSIAKIYNYKQKQFNKAKVFTPKVTYLLQDDLAQALTKFIQLKTIELSMELEAKKAISDARNYC